MATRQAVGPCEERLSRYSPGPSSPASPARQLSFEPSTPRPGSYAESTPLRVGRPAASLAIGVVAVAGVGDYTKAGLLAIVLTSGGHQRSAWRLGRERVRACLRGVHLKSSSSRRP
jgi:hypothetical protein